MAAASSAGPTAAAPPAAPLPTTSSQPGKAVLEILFTVIDKFTVQSLPEYGHLAPAIVILGSFLVSLVTLNFPLFMLGVSSLEAKAVEGLFGSFAAYTMNPLDILGKGQSLEKGKCTSSLSSIQSRFTDLMADGLRRPFPHSGIYYLSFIVAYSLQSLLFFAKEFTEYGPNYSSRVYIAGLSGAIFVLLYGAYLLANGCVGAGTIVLSIILGSVIGYLISIQNYTLFGKSSVNLTFIPPMEVRKGLDYVCVTQKTSTT